MPGVPTQRIPTVETRFEEFHLLEDLFKPRACLSGRRIVVWVYSDGSNIREIVLSGHAEGRTCASATSILIEAAKRLGDGVQWMLTCGAAYFRVSEEQLREVAPQGFYDDPILMEMLKQVPGGGRLQSPSAVLGEMIQALKELADEKGLVEIFHHDWQSLVAFRNAFQSRIGNSAPEIVLPRANGDVEIADYLPIIPGNHPDGEPLIFNLEGWDFDCPAFQLVADRHLRKVQRELLGDALRRRRQYRDWLRTWTDQWIKRLSWLPESQARGAMLHVPQEDAMQFPKPVTAAEFLNHHVAGFLDRGQFWHRDLAYLYNEMPYGQLSAAELDRKIRPNKITEVDFERGQTRERNANESDEAFTWRQRLLNQDPQMISHCLLYVRRMDWIIKPYEELRMKKVGGSSRQGKDEVEIVDEISRRIVIETMVRGWPSVYLQDKRDSAEFERWADEYRSHIWEIIAEQAENSGVALDILMEKNVVYDVRFNDDLGCTIQPLMLVDDRTHAQLHASSAGASVVVPLWSRLQSQTVPDYALRLGTNNRQRARQLVIEAQKQASGEHADPELCAGSLRLAMACHPAEAGKLILEEWFRRLGCDTSQEFERARTIITAAELLSRERYQEAKKYVDEYLAQEPNPVPDAFVISAMIESVGDENQRREIRKTYVEYKRLIPRHEELAAKLRQSVNPSNQMDMLGLLLKKQTISLEETERLRRIQGELDRLGDRLKTLQTELEKGTNRRRKLIEQSLHKPVDVRRAHPAMALAAEKASETLQLTLETDGVYRHWSDVMLRRYGDIRRSVEARGLLDILHALTMIAYQIDQNPNEARLQALKEMEELSSALWLPSEIESDLRNLAEEFGKGSWDRLQTLQIIGIIRDASSTCLSRMQDLLSPGIVTSPPLKEAIATRIHVTQTIEAKFKSALDMLLTATMSLGRSINGQWVIKDTQVTDVSEGAQFKFDKRSRIVSVVFNGSRTPLLQAKQISDEEVTFLAETFTDPTLPNRLNRFAPTLAEALLATEIVPCKAWQRWRDAMSDLRRELLVVLSNFGYEANLMPQHSPQFTSDGDFERRMDKMTPRASPKIDWEWRDLDTWGQFAGNSCRRTRVSSSVVK